MNQKYQEQTAEDVFTFLKLLLPRGKAFNTAVKALVTYTDVCIAEYKHVYIIQGITGDSDAFFGFWDYMTNSVRF